MLRRLALVILICFPATTARGALVHNFYGESVGPTASFTGSFVAGENVGGTYHAVQRDPEMIDFLQIVDLTTGDVSAPERFIPVVGELNPTGSEVGVGAIQALGDGGVHYFGNSNTGPSVAGATFWTRPNSPNLASLDLNVLGSIHDGTLGGRFVGGEDGLAVIGSPTQFLHPLPGNRFGSALGTSTDGRLVVGTAIWHDAGSGLTVFEPGGFFEVPADSLSLPNIWDHVKYDPALDDYVIGGLYLNSTTFLNNLGFWQFGTGELLATFDHTQEFRDWERSVDSRGDEFLTAVFFDGTDSLFYTFADESVATHTELFGEPAEVVDLFRGPNGLVRTAGGVNTLARYEPPPLFTLPGDFNGDGVVDGADFLEWQRGESPDPLSEAGLADWEDDLGSAVQANLEASTHVPEPATWALLCISLVCFALGVLYGKGTRRLCATGSASAH